MSLDPYSYLLFTVAESTDSNSFTEFTIAESTDSNSYLECTMVVSIDSNSFTEFTIAVSPHLSPSFPLTRKTLIHCLHLSLSPAAAFADAQLIYVLNSRLQSLTTPILFLPTDTYDPDTLPPPVFVSGYCPR